MTKNLVRCLMAVLLYCTLLEGNAQSFKAPNFGKDIIINDKPNQDQRLSSVCAAYNGWLYAVITYVENSTSGITFLKSIDNGISWIILLDDHTFGTGEFQKVELVVCGNEVPNLKLFCAAKLRYGTSGGAYVWRFNAEPFTYEDMIFRNLPPWSINDIAIATDFEYPSAGTSPFSIAVLYSSASLTPPWFYDSLICITSSNGGQSFDGFTLIGQFQNVDNVDIAFGRSSSVNNGTYFAVWDDIAIYDDIGHVYTAHTTTDFNSDFSTPLCLDSLAPSITNQVRNATISCQESEYDNDSGNISQLILFEKLNTVDSSSTIQGFYNLAGTTNTFEHFTLTDPSINCVYPQIAFNRFDTSFMVTWYDATDKLLPFVKTNANFSNPLPWTIVSDGYNDNDSLDEPYPTVGLNPYLISGINSWSSVRQNGNRKAMFDAPFSIYTPVQSDYSNLGNSSIEVYPNPSSQIINVRFINDDPSVTISLINSEGTVSSTLIEESISIGSHTMTIDITSCPSGLYIIIYKSGKSLVTQKLIIVH